MALGRTRRSALAGAALIALSVSGVGYAPAAQAQVSAGQRSFSVPAGQLSAAALRLSEQAGVQLVLGSEVTTETQASEVSGRFTIAQALDRLLVGTGLKWRYVSAGVIAIERSGLAQDTDPRTTNKVFGTVRVEGAQNLDAAGFGKLDSFGRGAGANGSSDAAATEGTGSYTTNGSVVASRTPQALQQTTQSVTVMTQQRLKEQNLTDLNQVLDFTPGISVDTNTAHEQSYFSRGFEITNYSVDGGAPFSFSPAAEGSLDLAEYDRIEVLRGSAALLGSVGEPGGIISLIRKRPLDYTQFTLEVQGGTWNYYRVAVDATGPIAFDGHLRGRVIGSALNRDFFFDFSHETRPKIFGSLELDLWTNALIRGGASIQQQDISEPNNLGLPRYTNGDPLPLSRKTCYCASFAYQNLTTTEYFGTFEQRFFRNWTFKADATFTETDGDSLYPSLSAPNPTGTDAITPGQTTTGQLFGQNVRSDNKFDNFGLNANLDGSFNLFGRKQVIALGAQSTRTRLNSAVSQFNFFGFGQYFSVPVFGFTQDQVPLPPLDPLAITRQKTNTTVRSAYGQLDLELLRGLHLNGGARYTEVRAKSANGLTIFPPFVETPVTAFQDPVVRKSGGWSPSASASYDLKPWFTVYGSYNDIFSPQNTAFFAPTVEGDYNTALPLPPARGRTYEAGLRVKLRGGKLNGHLAYYDTLVNGLAIGVFTPPDAISGCCNIVGGKTLSKGVDFELNGEVFEGFQLAASYNYNKNRTANFPARPSDINNAFNNLFPHHLARVHASYDFLSGALQGLSLSAGLRLESSRSIVNLRCAALDENNTCTAGGYFFFKQSGYNVVDGLINYRLNKNFELSANLYNILDKKYFSQPSSTSGQNYYGQPRSFILTLRTILGERID